MASKIWHHVAESNWINFVVVGAVVYAGWLYVNGLRNELSDKTAQIQQQKVALELASTQAKLESEVTAMTISTLAEYVESRLDNIEDSKKVGKANWIGVRKVEY